MKHIWDSDQDISEFLDESREKYMDDPDNAEPPKYSDDDLALRFTAEHADNVRYIAAFNHWMLWNDTYWAEDKTLKVFSMARDICRAASFELANLNHKSFEIKPNGGEKVPKPSVAGGSAKSIASSKTVAAVVSLCRSDRYHAATIEQWNTDPMLFTGNNGTSIELISGEPRQSMREDYATKCGGVDVPSGECPIWMNFLDEITGKDLELQAYLQRMAGYCLTGVTTEHVLFFCYGTGANGKSVFISTLVGIWGDYATIAPMETFVESQTDRHPTEIAHLHGARLVVAHETERDRSWAESKIKALTGGDKISARYMHQNFFEFIPQFKLIIVGNHKPAIPDGDEAMHRRIQMVPFSVTIPEEDRDPDLTEKLKAEWPAILRWCVEGCFEWQHIGLAPPAAVKDATTAYIEDEDIFSRWIEESCVVGKQQWGIGDHLWKSWKRWSDRNNERSGSRKAFAQMLIKRGFASVKSQHVRGYNGLDLSATEKGDRSDR